MYTEHYELDYIQPIISKELFQRVQEIRKLKNTRKQAPTGLAKFPLLFKCICGRNLRRDDKKNQRYLRCPKHTNKIHQEPCSQKYTNLNVLEPQIEKIFRKLIPNKATREKMNNYIEQQLKMKATEKNKLLHEKTQQHTQLQDKLDDVTTQFVE